MGLIKAIGRWIGSVFVLTEWHAEGSAGGRVAPVTGKQPARVAGHDARVTRSIVSKFPAHEKGHNEPLTPERIAKEPAPTPAPPPSPLKSIANHNPNACPPGPPPAFATEPKYAKIPATSMFASQIRHAEKLVVVQQLTKDEVALIPGGVQRKWCGTSGGGVVVHDMNAVLTLVSLVKQVVGEGGGSPRYLAVRVVRLDGRAADYVINITDAEWSKAFEANNAHFVAGL